MSSSKKSKAGKASGVRRAGLTRVRRFLVLSAFERLKPKHQTQPYSTESINALEDEFRSPQVFNLFPQVELLLQDYEFVVNRKARVPSEKLMAMVDDALIHLLKNVPESVRQASRETLIDDLKELGIRSKMRKQRSG
jgi:hypothetical protein